MKHILKTRFFSITEVAKMLSVHPDTISRWINEEKIKAVRIGRERHISENQLGSFLKIQN